MGGPKTMHTTCTTQRNLVFYSMMKFCTILYSELKHYSTILYTEKFSILLYDEILYNTLQWDCVAINDPKANRTPPSQIWEAKNSLEIYHPKKWGVQKLRFSPLYHWQGLLRDLPKSAFTWGLSKKAYQGEKTTKDSFMVFYVCFFPLQLYP